MTEPRNWDKELADIDRVIAKGGAAPPSGGPPVAVGTALPAPGPAGRPAVAGAPRKRDLVGVWFKVLLGAAGAAALAVWPYNRSCSTGLYLYLALLFFIVMAGIWAMHGAWRHRRPAAHVAGLLVLLGAVVLLAREILPRTGYAAHALTWTCQPTK